ncbi:hypothetical protein [Clostridium sp. BL-8]|uniref:hypothetical protein n=1 Tax=Clostridium sp. BL-8 TaxID=349938 RepID=UPI00098CB239|nr:hypothetical protein [Clostridium sp. BL-8]OOM69846.1 hypothetical protein CLOBL_51340 [Clostridium sp. BL-8]
MTKLGEMLVEDGIKKCEEKKAIETANNNTTYDILLKMRDDLNKLDCLFSIMLVKNTFRLTVLVIQDFLELQMV